MKYLLTLLAVVAIGILTGCETPQIGTIGNGELDNPIEAIPESVRATALKAALYTASKSEPKLTPYLTQVFAVIDKAYAENDSSKDIVLSILQGVTTSVTDGYIQGLIIKEVEKINEITVEENEASTFTTEEARVRA